MLAYNASGYDNHLMLPKKAEKFNVTFRMLLKIQKNYIFLTIRKKFCAKKLQCF